MQLDVLVAVLLVLLDQLDEDKVAVEEGPAGVRRLTNDGLDEDFCELRHIAELELIQPQAGGSSLWLDHEFEEEELLVKVVEQRGGLHLMHHDLFLLVLPFTDHIAFKHRCGRLVHVIQELDLRPVKGRVLDGDLAGAH